MLPATGFASVPASFWQELAEAPAALLLLDYDGTLAPFRVERLEAVPYPGVRSRLQRLLQSRGTRLVIVSGRSAAEVVRLLGVSPPPEIWGMHGLERQRPDGTTEREEPTAAALAILDEAARQAEAAGLAGERLERKPAAVAAHWRGLSSMKTETIRRELQLALERLVDGSPMELHSFDGGLEVRPRGIDKGRAVERLLAEESARAAVAYLGDDVTDEDAFRALGGRGLSVLVRSQPRPTAADLRLEPPLDLLRFLDLWIELRQGRTHG
jgi:trehalose-phosphatase